MHTVRLRFVSQFSRIKVMMMMMMMMNDLKLDSGST